jgi:hypothetical protein
MQIRTSRFHFLVAAAALALFMLALPLDVRAAGPDFSITATDFSPSPVNQGVSAAATLTIQPLNGFTGTVSLQCSVTPVLANGPTCQPSQPSVTPPAQPSITLTTFANTPAVLYTVTVTASSTNTTVIVPLTDTVVSVIPDYTITIDTAISPTSVHAGSGATVVLDINPVSYSGTVTPVCTSITPPVQFSPICTFNPPAVTVAGATPVTTTLTISTTGPNTTTASGARHSTTMLAVWLLIPGFAFCGFALQRQPRRTSLLRCLLLAFTVFALAFLPSCNLINGSSSSGNTPNNTYSITISGVDNNQVGPSNSSVSVSLIVD